MDSVEPQQPDTFFAVSTFKLVAMSLCTFGLYQIYWLYWNWRIIKQREHRRISPPWRSVLGLIFLYPLLRRIARQSKKRGLGMVPAAVLSLAWIATSSLSYTNLPLLSALSFASVAALVPAQNAANALNSIAAPSAPRNDRFSRLNWVALVLGGPLFALTILGLLVQSVQT